MYLSSAPGSTPAAAVLAAAASANFDFSPFAISCNRRASTRGSARSSKLLSFPARFCAASMRFDSTSRDLIISLYQPGKRGSSSIASRS